MTSRYFIASRVDPSNNITDEPLGLLYNTSIQIDNSANIYCNDVSCNILNYTSLNPPIPQGLPGYLSNSTEYIYNQQFSITNGECNINNFVIPEILSLSKFDNNGLNVENWILEMKIGDFIILSKNDSSYIFYKYSLDSIFQLQNNIYRADVQLINSSGSFQTGDKLYVGFSPKGPQGATGLVGFSGADGPTGSPGPIGVQGATGTPGVIGAQGATGSNGALGAQGATGGNLGGSSASIFLGKSSGENINVDYALVVISWDIQTLITSSVFNHNITTNNNEIMVNLNGIYFIDCNIGWENIPPPSNGRFVAKAAVFKNGIEVTTTISYSYSRGSSYGKESIQITTQLQLVAGDKIEIRAGKDYSETSNNVDIIPSLSELKITRFGTEPENIRKVSYNFFTDIGGTAYGNNSIAMVPSFNLGGSQVSYPVLPSGAGAYWNKFGKTFNGEPTQGSPETYGQVMGFDGSIIALNCICDGTAFTTASDSIYCMNYSQGIVSNPIRIPQSRPTANSIILDPPISFNINEYIGICVGNPNTGDLPPSGTLTSGLIVLGTLIVAI